MRGESFVVILDGRYASGLFLTCQKGQLQSFRPFQFKRQTAQTRDVERTASSANMKAGADERAGPTESPGEKIDARVSNLTGEKAKTLGRWSGCRNMVLRAPVANTLRCVGAERVRALPCAVTKVRSLALWLVLGKPGFRP